VSLLEKNLGQLSVDRGIILKRKLKRMLSDSGCVSVNNIVNIVIENVTLWLQLSDSGYVSVNNIVKIVMTTQVPYSTENS
jgi:hypothetical protein